MGGFLANIFSWGRNVGGNVVGVNVGVNVGNMSVTNVGNMSETKLSDRQQIIVSIIRSNPIVLRNKCRRLCR